MSESICNVFSTRQERQDLRIAHFVYETEFHTLPQPFLPLIHYLHIVTAGSGTFCMDGAEYPLSVGSIFFAFPARQFTVKAGKDFRYVYISFMGNDVQSLLDEMQITPHYPVYPGHSNLCELFYTTVRNSRGQNTSILAQGLLYYTLSRLLSLNMEKDRQPNQQFAVARDYLEKHYADPAMSLKTLSKVCSYTEKYLSALFIKRMGISFGDYLTVLRIQRAKELLAMRIYTVGQVAQLCGFTDQLYFSKVFKKKTGFTPTQYRDDGCGRWHEEG